MFSQAHYPTEPIQPGALDDYLAKGWFRTGQTIFTCAYLHLRDEVYRAFWLRVALDQLTVGKTLQKLLRVNANFRVEIQQASITPEKEALYTLYKSGLSFDPSDTLQTLLYHQSDYNIYNTWEVTIYDDHQLIAAGFFDVGKNSAAGIASFYNPAYKKNSLGKYLIYQKMLYCQDQGMDHFYLGYFVPGCRAFDYKLDLAKSALQYLEIYSGKWVPISFWDPVTSSLEETREKLLELQQRFTVESRLLTYRFSHANLIRELDGFELFDHHQLIYFYDYEPAGFNPVVVYDIRDRQYHLYNCYSIGMPEELKEDRKNFSAQILKIQERIYSTSNIREMAELVPRVLLVAKKQMG